MNVGAASRPSGVEVGESVYRPAGWRRVVDAPAVGVIYLGVLAYRATLGPFMGGACRHTPTCSQYMLDAVAKHGPWRGGWRGVCRIVRCRPGGTFGHDPA
ncbi:MAG: membrane protein insertion efficiency factor YidD [Planctomycetota bacterium]